MKQTFHRKIGLSLAFLSLFAPLVAQADEPSRIVSIGGSVTEIVYALEQQDRLVARDTTSSFPAAATKLPNVGYARALSPEGVLSVDPDLILATAGSGPPETLEVLKQANVIYIEVPEIYSAEGVVTKIETVGKALGQEQAAAALATKVRVELGSAQALATKVAGNSPKSVLFVLSTTGGRIMVAGKDTGADGIITMAGAVNAIDDFSGYKQVSDEAIAVAAPDVILVMKRDGDHGLTKESMRSLPALMLTPAAQNGQLVRMNGLRLLGFGPRTATAVKDLSQAIYGAAE
ncbi:heme/hemin ABC transporter substrate-binding protein [Pseudophaeobacter sp.]|uniref:heme/hemin ABC transporter substrate-binding protein n=1 Tax=Pseudophaeobacter sp. TaxID=1971739 RepID=UPI0040580B4B